MSKTLVIVESPAKAKTIKKYLPKGFEVEDRVLVWLLPDGEYKLYQMTDYSKKLKTYLDGNQ